MHGAWKRNIWLTASLSCSTRLVGGWSVLYNNLSIYWNTNDSVLARTLRSFKCMHSKRSHVYNYQAHQDPTHLSFPTQHSRSSLWFRLWNVGPKQCRHQTKQYTPILFLGASGSKVWSIHTSAKMIICMYIIYIWLLFMLQIIYIYIYLLWY